MVHFDFKLSDVDAENLISWLRDEEFSKKAMAITCQLANDRKMAKQYRKMAQYTDSVIKKMHNHREGYEARG